jgi:hypothetical protein
MLTRAEATQQGIKFAELWDAEKHTISEDGIKTFAQDLSSLNNLPAPEKNALKWAELRGATDGLIARKVLPNLDVADNKTNLRNCRIVGLTADGDKNSGNDDLVVAIGRQKDNASKAENVVILAQDGKFYQARQVQGGYVRSEQVIAENAAELERKYNRSGFTPRTENDKTKEKPNPEEKARPELIAENRGNPADLEVFRQELKSFQNQSPAVESLAQTELDRLAREFSQLSKDQQKIAFFDVLESNRQLEETWLCGRSRPKVAIQRGADGKIRFSADWTEGMSWAPREHHVYSQKFNLETR